jgi:hypothetical protein
MFYAGAAVGFVLGALAFWLDRYVFGPPVERSIERAKRESYFRRYAREEALRQDNDGRV